MSNEVYGPISDIDDVVALVDKLQLKGMIAKNISIFTNKAQAKELRERTDVIVETNMSGADNENNESWMDKVKDIFIREDSSARDIHDQLIHLGVSDTNAAMYTKDIADGQLLIVADDEIRMGNDPLSDSDYNSEGLSVRRNV